MSVLDELVAGALEDQRSRECVVSLEDVRRAALAAPAPIDATRWLKRPDGIPVIAEIKRASPSKGHLSDIPDPAALARASWGVMSTSRMLKRSTTTGLRL